MKSFSSIIESINALLDPVSKLVVSQRAFIGRVLVTIALLIVPLTLVRSTLGTTGSAAFLLLWIILFMPIFAKVFGLKIFAVAMPLRKELGILMATFALVHGATYYVAPALYDTSVGRAANSVYASLEREHDDRRERPESKETSKRDVSTMKETPPQKAIRVPPTPLEKSFWTYKGNVTYVAYGFIAAIIAFILLLTSNVFSVRFLGQKKWKLLQRSAYVMLVFVVAHVAMIEYVKKGEIEAGPIVMLVIYFGLKVLEWKGINLAKKNSSPIL